MFSLPKRQNTRVRFEAWPSRFIICISPPLKLLSVIVILILFCRFFSKISKNSYYVTIWFKQVTISGQMVGLNNGNSKTKGRVPMVVRYEWYLKLSVDRPLLAFRTDIYCYRPTLGLSVVKASPSRSLPLSPGPQMFEGWITPYWFHLFCF